jgi:hypothetical protein
LIAYALLRSNLESHGDADVAKSVAYGKRVKVYPLSQAANPFFTSLDRVVQSEPWLRSLESH